MRSYPELEYRTLERIPVQRPVERVAFIANLCRDKNVLDIGCLDETAVKKQGTDDWLHRRIARVANTVLGVDSSSTLPDGGLVTGPNARIVKGDGLSPNLSADEERAVEVIVAGEFIEHLENPLAFIRAMKAKFTGRLLILSTPNGVAFANALLGTVGREAQHPDHLLTSTFKTLNMLCKRAECSSWEIIPYRFYATEMLLDSKGVKRLAIKLVQSAIRAIEWMFPLRSFGYVVHITL